MPNIPTFGSSGNDIPTFNPSGSGIPTFGSVPAAAPRYSSRFRSAMDTLERVRLGRMSVDQARKQLSSLSDNERQQLKSLVWQRSPDREPTNQLAALEKSKGGGGGLLGTLKHVGKLAAEGLEL